MLLYTLMGLLAAWVLSLFGFGTFMIAGLAELGITITMTGYYIIFAIVGLLGWIFSRANGKGD